MPGIVAAVHQNGFDPERPDLFELCRRGRADDDVVRVAVRRQHREDHAHRAGAHDEHVVAVADVHLIHGVHAAGDGLGKAALVEADVIRQPDRLALGDLHIFREAAVRLVPQIPFVRAVDEIALFAVVADAAGNGVVGGDPVAHPEGRDGVADLMDIAGELMTRNQRIPGAAAAAGQLVVRLDAVADAAAHHPDDDVMAPADRIGHLADRRVFPERLFII